MNHTNLSPTERAILAVVDREKDIDTKKISHEIGVSVDTIYKHLRQLKAEKTIYSAVDFGKPEWMIYIYPQLNDEKVTNLSEEVGQILAAEKEIKVHDRFTILGTPSDGVCIVLVSGDRLFIFQLWSKLKAIRGAVNIVVTSINRP